MLDGGPTAGGIESTVLDMTTAPPRLLRPGLIGPAELEAVIGPVGRTGATQAGAALPSPGMLPRHYSPRTPLECSRDGAFRVRELLRSGVRVGWLTRSPPPEPAPQALVVRIMPADPTEYAAHLYAVLHALDDAGLERIVVDLPPDTEEWLALRDRLRRAGHAGRGE